MADLEKTIKILFQGDDQLSGPMGSIAAKFDKFSELGGKVATISEPLANATDKIIKLDAALAALVAGGMYYAVKKSVEFESAVVELRKVVGDSPKEIEAATNASKDLALTYGESSSKILASTSDFVQAGFSTKEAMDLTKTAMDLVIAGSIPAANASEYLISILKGFKAPAEEAARVTDILNEVSNRYATDVEQLAIGMATLSPIAHTMGFSLEETAGILTPVIEIFRSGSESAVALKTGLLKLIDDAKPVREALGSIGVSQKDANGQLRSGKDILLDVSKAFETLSEPQKLFVTQQLVGIEQAGRMVEVFNGLNKTLEVTEVALNSAGSAQKEVDARLASSEVQIKRVGTAFEETAIAIGDKFKTSLISGVADPLRNVLDGVRVGIDKGAFDPLFSFIDQVSKNLGEKIRLIAQNLPEAMKDLDFSGLINSLGGLGDALGGAFDAIFGDIDLTTAEGLHEALQKIIDGFTALVNVTDGIIEGLKPLFVAIGEGIEKFSEMDGESQELVGNLLGVGKVVNVIAENAGMLTGALTALAINGFASTALKIGEMVKAANVAVPAVTSLGGALGVLSGLGAAAAGGWTIGSLLNQIPAVQQASQSLLGLIDVTNNYFGAQQIVGKELDDINAKYEEAVRKHQAMAGGTSKMTSATLAFVESVEKIPDSKEVEFRSEIDEMINNVAKVTLGLSGIPGVKKTELALESDKYYDGLVRAGKATKEVLGDYTMYTLVPEVDKKKIDEAAKTLDEKIPKEKKTEITIEVEKIKADAEKVQKAIEWKAKIDIAQIEAATKLIEASFASINTGIESTGKLMGDMFSAFTKVQGLDRGFIEEQVKNEAKRRDEEFMLQKELIDAQVRLIKIKADTMERGDKVINIQADGLKPHLEAILWEVLEAVQLRVNEEASEFLLGIA